VLDVVVVRWPQEQSELERLARQQIPRLLLVEPDAAPPITEDVLEDWVRLPADHRELTSRLENLRRRAETLLSAPLLDRRGRLVFRGRWTNVTPTEERLLARLTHRFDDVVPAAELLATGWPEQKPSANAIRVTFHRLRVRLRPIGLELRRFDHGWLLQARDDDRAAWVASS
jgi:two-component system, OmpR family, response regulator